MQRWLLSRMFDLDQPAPHFAFYGTVNWIRALALAVENEGYGDEKLQDVYASVPRRPIDVCADTVVFEKVFLAFNHLAGLLSIADFENGYDVCRPAISSWYHVICAASASMVAAASGRQIDVLDELASAWQEGLVSQNLVRLPFSLSVSTLVKAASEDEVELYRRGNPHDLSRTPSDAIEAWGGVVSYLHGTTKFERERVEGFVRATPEFLELNVADFRSKRARELRDSHLSAGMVNFLVEASRFSRKASFRDSIFLSYGDNHQSEIDQFLVDLGDVANAFLRMACAYCARRVEEGAWDDFVDDIEANSRLSLNADMLRL